MDFSLNEDQQAIVDMARQFSREELAPNAAEWDEKSHFPVETMRHAASLGLAAIYTGEAHGGSDLTRLDAALIFQELSAGCVSTAAYISIHNMVCWMIDRFGSDELRQEFIPQLASMDLFASYCLTEPSAGSDAASLKTKAVKDGDDYLLTGEKAFISGGGVSDIYLVMARTGGDGPDGISAFLVPKDTPGLSFGAQEKKMGWKSQPTSAVIMSDCRIPARNMLGKEGDGFRMAMQGLDGGRVNIASCSLGGSRFALTKAAQYAQERQQFGKPIAAFQASQFKLADMLTHLQASQMMVWRAARAIDNNDPRKTQYCAQAKRFATDMGFQIVNDALQLHGGYGYIREYEMERVVRDLRVHQILEGTNEIMRVIIARQMGKDLKEEILALD